MFYYLLLYFFPGQAGPKKVMPVGFTAREAPRKARHHHNRPYPLDVCIRSMECLGAKLGTQKGGDSGRPRNPMGAVQQHHAPLRQTLSHKCQSFWEDFPHHGRRLGALAVLFNNDVVENRDTPVARELGA